EIDREGERLAGEQPGMRLQHLDRPVEYPAIDGRHELVALRGRHETLRAERMAVIVDHANQQLVMRSRAFRAGERQYELCVEAKAPGVYRVAQLSGNVDISKAPHETHVVGLVNFHAIAAAVLGGLARGLGCGEGMHELASSGIEQGDANTDGDVQA